MFIRAAPRLLGALIGALAGLVVWGFPRSQKSEASFGLTARDDVLLGFMLLGALGLGAFFVYLFLILEVG